MRVSRSLAAAVALALILTTILFAAPHLAERSTLNLPLLSTPGIAVPPLDTAGERLTVPEGFALRSFASDLNRPRLMAIGPDEHLYVAERGANRIVRLPDRNRDGLADGSEIVADNLGGVHSLEWYDGALYAAMNGQVVRLEDLNDDGDMQDPGEQTVIVTGLPNDGGHSSRTARFGPDGKLYVAVGSKCNVEAQDVPKLPDCSEGDPRRAAILRYNPDGSIPDDNPFADDADPRRRAVWAVGLRNAVDFLFLPDGRLWATHNGSDGLGDDKPPEEIVIEVEAGKHYGWPFCYTAEVGVVPEDAQEVQDPRIPFAPPVNSCADVVPARFTDLAHQAPLGAARYDGRLFPAAYQGDLYVAYHGSWNSSVPRDCRVQRIQVVAGAPVAGEPFVTGFRDNESQSCGSAWGRPAGVVVGAGGELFISDDKNGMIYRVVYVGPAEIAWAAQ
jgi:glucose/arabinose dehydrogenase